MQYFDALCTKRTEKYVKKTLHLEIRDPVQLDRILNGFPLQDFGGHEFTVHPSSWVTFMMTTPLS
jgi:hypothetical protein